MSLQQVAVARSDAHDLAVSVDGLVGVGESVADRRSLIGIRIELWFKTEFARDVPCAGVVGNQRAETRWPRVDGEITRTI